MTRITVGDVREGDRVRNGTGMELTVTRIDVEFLGRPNLLALVEDSETQWLKIAGPRDSELELISRASERET